MGKKQVKSFYFTCLIIFREFQLAASSFLVLNPDLHLGIEVWYFKSLVYRYIAPYIVHILSSLSTFVQATVITMHWTNLNKQFETIGSLALLYIYNDAIIGSIYNICFSIMRIKHIKYITEIEKNN